MTPTKDKPTINQEKKNPDEIMRVFANLLIDRFIEDAKNNELKTKIPMVNIRLD